MAEHTVAKVSEVSPGTSLVVEAGEKIVALFNVDGEFFAIDNTCVHQGGPLADGTVDKDKVTCPWHAWSYEIKTGKCNTFPDKKVAKYPVRVEEENIIISDEPSS